MSRNHDRLKFVRRIGFCCACVSLVLAMTAPAQAGIKIVPSYDQSINSLWNAKKVKDVINNVIKFYESKLTDDVTINIAFFDTNSGLGQSLKPIYTIAYPNYLTALTNDATTQNDTIALSKLPKQFLDPVLGNPKMFIAQANLKALGFKTPNGIDGQIGLNTGLMFTDTAGIKGNKYDMYAVVAHEIDEVLGLGSAVGFSGILPHDLYRYDANGNRSFTTDSTAISYFSIDTVVKRARFNQESFGDYGDWFSGVAAVTPQVQDAFATAGILIDRKMNNELLALDVIGYNVGVQNKAAIAGLTGAQYYGVRSGQQVAGVKIKSAPLMQNTPVQGKGLFFPQK